MDSLVLILDLFNSASQERQKLVQTILQRCRMNYTALCYMIRYCAMRGLAIEWNYALNEMLLFKNMEGSHILPDAEKIDAVISDCFQLFIKNEWHVPFRDILPTVASYCQNKGTCTAPFTTLEGCAPVPTEFAGYLLEAKVVTYHDVYMWMIKNDDPQEYWSLFPQETLTTQSYFAVSRTEELYTPAVYHAARNVCQRLSTTIGYPTPAMLFDWMKKWTLYGMSAPTHHMHVPNLPSIIQLMISLGCTQPCILVAFEHMMASQKYRTPDVRRVAAMLNYDTETLLCKAIRFSYIMLVGEMIEEAFFTDAVLETGSIGRRSSSGSRVFTIDHVSQNMTGIITTA